MKLELIKKTSTDGIWFNLFVDEQCVVSKRHEADAISEYERIKAEHLSYKEEVIKSEEI